MRWRCVKGPDKKDEFHVLLSRELAARTDGVKLYKEQKGVLAHYPDGSHYLLTWQALTEDLPDVATPDPPALPKTEPEDNICPHCNMKYGDREYHDPNCGGE